MDEDPLPDGLGEIILDPVFFQWFQSKTGADEGEGGDFGEEGDDDMPDWFKTASGEDNEPSDEKKKEGPPGAKEGGKEKASGNDLPSGVKGGQNGQKEALAASMSMLRTVEEAQRTVEVLRKSHKVHNGRQTIDVEIVGE
jgi:hypothetical protein